MRNLGLWIVAALLTPLLATTAFAVLVFAVLLARAPSLKVQRLDVSFHRADGGDGLATDLARTLERRLSQAGVEGDVFPSGAEILHVDLPLEADSAVLRKELATRAELAFELVEDSGPDEARLRAALGSAACPDCLVACSSGATRECYLLQRKPVATGRDLKDARASTDAIDQPSLQLRFSPKGAAALQRFSLAHVGRRLAIVLDGAVLSAPAIQGQLGAEVQITGAMTPEEAATVARQLAAGALSAPVEIGPPQVTLSRPARRLLLGLAGALAATGVLVVSLIAVVVALRRRSAATPTA